ncbi:MAG: ribonuclease J [Oligoflexus sp.]
MTELVTQLKSAPADALDTIFIGGCGEFGMNMTFYIHQGKLNMVDCGLAFAEDYELGVDAHIPKVDEIIDLYGGVAHYLITHGHEDHVGALPYFLKKWPAPVYLTAWTLEILKDRMARAQMSLENYDIRLVRAGDHIKFGELSAHWIHKPHSIPMCCSLWITAGPYQIYHTGDFKMDPSPLYEKGPDWELIKQAAASGIDLLVADSTNATKTGFCPGEQMVIEPLEKLIAAANKLVVFTTFSSNFWRLKTIVGVAKRLGRKVLPCGAGIQKCFDIATELGLYEPKPGLFIEAEAFSQYQRHEVLVLASGSQFENRSALRRIVQDEHPQIRLQTGDSLILSSRIIPGNEKSVFSLMSHCHDREVEVLTSYDHPDIHVSGHAYQEDLQVLGEALKPKYYIPVHGTFTQLLANSSLLPAAKAQKVRNGCVLRLNSSGLQHLGDFELERLFIDSWSRRPMSYENLRTRLRIGDSGMLLITGYVLQVDRELKTEVHMESMGIPFADELEYETWREQAAKKITQLLQGQIKLGAAQEDELNETIRREIRRDLTRIFVKKPVVICKLAFATKA